MTKADFNSVKTNLMDGFSATHNDPMTSGLSVSLEKIHGNSPDYVDVPLTFERTPTTAASFETAATASPHFTINEAQSLVGGKDSKASGKAATSLTQSIFPQAAETTKVAFEAVTEDVVDNNTQN